MLSMVSPTKSRSARKPSCDSVSSAVSVFWLQAKYSMLEKEAIVPTRPSAMHTSAAGISRRTRHRLSRSVTLLALRTIGTR